MENRVSINYQTREDYCNCCGQNLPRSKTSDFKKFEITKDDIKGWVDWKSVAEYEDDMDDCVREYVYETISFFAANRDSKVLVKGEEFEKVKQFVLEEIVK